MKIERVMFVGSKKLGLEVLKRMYLIDPDSLVGVITLDDSKDSRSVLEEFRNYCCIENDIGMYVPTNRRMFDSIIHDLKPDLCIVVCWYWLIKKELLDMVLYGFVGIHHSSLPEYRGGAPLVWQIINGKRYIGSSIFTFTEDMDAGPIWDKIWVTVNEEDSVKDVLGKLEGKILTWFDENYLKLLDLKIEPSPQSEDGVSYCAQRFPCDGKIDWNKGAREIYNFIRAQSDPYPGAFTYYQEEKLTILKVRPVDMVYYGTPGQVARVTKEGVYVICGDSKPILLEEVRLEDGEKKPANKVLRSFRVRLK